jgi:hypothetical protein
MPTNRQAKVKLLSSRGTVWETLVEHFTWGGFGDNDSRAVVLWTPEGKKMTVLPGAIALIIEEEAPAAQ